MSTASPLRSGGTCSLEVDTTLPLVCIGSLLSFLCGVGIGANDLSANFAMVVGSGSLNMKQAIVYCTIFELLGAAFMGGHVGNTIRNGIVQTTLFNQNRDLVIIGMTCATFAAALWLYLSTVFGLPVSITHTVIGSIIGFAVFSTWSFSAIRVRGVVVIVLSWVLAPVAACAVTALCFYAMRTYVLLVPGRSFQLALRVLPYCLAASLLVDYMFIVIERPPILTVTLASYLPIWALYLLLLAGIIAFCWAAARWAFPSVADVALTTSAFVWESPALRTEPITDTPPTPPPSHPLADETSTTGARAATTATGGDGSDALDSTLSLFRTKSSATRVASKSSRLTSPPRAKTAADSTGASAPEFINESFGSLLFAKTPAKTTTTTEASVSIGKTETTAENVVASSGGIDEAPRGRFPGPCPASRSSTILTSITASDSHIMRSTSVHLAPVGGRRSPVPFNAACTTRSSSCSVTQLSTPQAHPADSPYRHFDVSQLPTASAAADESAALLASATTSVATSHGYGAMQSTSAAADSSALTPLHTTSFVAPSRTRARRLSTTGVSPAAAATASTTATTAALVEPDSDDVDTMSVCSDDEFGEEDWMMDHPMEPIRFGGLLIKPFNPRAEFLFTGLQVVAGSMSSFVHGAVAGANATATFVILYEVFSNHELGETGLSARWSVLPAMLGIAIGMFSLGAALMKTVGMELVTVTPARGWCIQVGGTLVTMVLTGLGIPVSLSQSQVGAAIGCGMLDAKMKGVSWRLVGKIVGGWVVTLVISAVTTGLTMLLMASMLCE